MTLDWMSLASGMTEMAIRALLALIFLQGGIQKLRHSDEFQGVVANYRILPAAWSRPAAKLLPFVEIALTFALFAGLKPWAEWAAAGLLMLFAGAMAINVMRGRRDVDCGCFQSAHRQTIGWETVGRNIALVAAAAMAGLTPAHAIPAPAAVEATAAGVILFVLYNAFNSLDALRLSRTALSNMKDA